jgi:hypothetical protein
MKKTLVSVLILSTALAASFAQAQPRGERREHERREHERERFHTPHWVFDTRFHHNHYYPEVGYALTVLPAGNVAITFRGGRYFFHSGVWYQPVPSGYVVVHPPRGVIVPVLPPAYTTVVIAGVPYYYANDVYYVQGPGGYVVAEPPAAAAAPVPQAPPPPGPMAPQASPAPQAGAGVWYYCESAKGYYPYVAECREGWRQVPATPPR